MKTFFSLFTGLGGADIGCERAGYQSLGGCELDPDIADLYNLNHSATIEPQDVLQIESVPPCDLLWASPPCINFSSAKLRNRESALDLLLASKIADLADYAKSVVIENVPAYQHSESFQMLMEKLIDKQFFVDRVILDARNFGCPSRRTRLFLRASKTPLKAVTPTHSLAEVEGLWWDSIADLWETLPDTFLTEKQQAVIGGLVSRPTTFAIERCAYYREPRIYGLDKHPPTIRSHSSHDGKGSYRTAFNVVRGTKVKKATLECLARWQGLSNLKYPSCDPVTVAKAIGNAVPPQLSEAVCRSL